MAEQNINQTVVPVEEPLHTEIIGGYEPEAEKPKAGIWTLIIGVILLIRGVMRYNEGGGIEIFGVIMFIIGLASLYYYFKDRF